MGKEVSEDEKNKVSWDSNAITPGTPFMDLLATSLRYWVVQKINSDPGWKNVSIMRFALILFSIPFFRYKSSYLMRGFQGKGSTRSWIILDDREVTQVMTLILGTLFMAWFVLFSTALCLLAHSIVAGC